MIGEGKIFLIATPIGNLGDISRRAIETIRSCEILLCEDTRHTGKLLAHLDIRGPKLWSFHEHNEDQKLERVIAEVERGAKIGLVSDAGTPELSDPGFKLIRAARQRGLRVEPVPGPFAAALALVASGLAPTPFAFFGFVPARKNERLRFYEELRAKEMTAVVYESPNRLIPSLQSALDVLGDVDTTIAREMTKLHEEFIHGRISEVLAEITARERIRGEVTIVFAPGSREPKRPSVEQLDSDLADLLKEGMRRTEALKELAARYGIRKNELYRLLRTE